MTPSELTDAPRAAPKPFADARLAARLLGAPMPEIDLRSAWQGRIGMNFITRNAAIVYFYPGALSQPVAAQDTAQARDFRDHYAQLLCKGYHVIGVHAQSTSRQLQHMMDGVEHFLVADPQLQLADALELPTYEIAGARVYRRLTLIVEAARVVHAIYPVEQPSSSATQALDWLRRSRPWGALAS